MSQMKTFGYAVALLAVLTILTLPIGCGSSEVAEEVTTDHIEGPMDGTQEMPSAVDPDDPVNAAAGASIEGVVPEVTDPPPTGGAALSDPAAAVPPETAADPTAIPAEPPAVP